MLESIFSNTWSVALVALFFGGSIFVHELGHFLAARWRGLHVDRFSIGFGPKIVSWVRNGVEYRLSWLPLGGYVALPQLADMSGIEGESEVDVRRLPPISYTDKMIVSVAGAVFNVLFAFVLALGVWVFGLPTDDLQESTSVGFVIPTVVLGDGTEVPSPASLAGLQAGDRIVNIDGMQTRNWTDVRTALVTGTSQSKDGSPRTTVTIERQGTLIDLELFPERAGAEKRRQIGIAPAEPLVVGRTFQHSPAEQAGLQRDDRIVAANGTPLHSPAQLQDIVTRHADREIELTVLRGETTLTAMVRPVVIKITNDGLTMPRIGVVFYRMDRVIYPGPFEQLERAFATVRRVLVALFSPKSDIGINDMSGLPGIATLLYRTSQIDFRLVLWITAVINVNLAVLNLLPIPVLDGGHMVFATVARLRGRPLPPSFVASAQGTFMVVLFSLMIFIAYNDIGRCTRENREVDEFQRRYIPEEYPALAAVPAP